MSNSSRFSALNTKISGMHGKMLKDKDYLKLISEKSVEETKEAVLDFLGKKDFYTREMPVYFIEIELKKYGYDNIVKLRNFLSGNYKSFFDALTLNFTIADIKIILRALQRKGDTTSLRNRLLVLSEDKNYEISSSDSIGSFVEKIKDTVFYKVLRAYEDETDETILFYMEMNLDRFYFQNIIEKSNGLDRSDRKYVKDLIGKQIDLLNITWIYRGIKYYNLLAEELFNFSIMGGLKLNYNEIKKLCYVKDTEEFKDIILQSDYSFLFDSHHDIDLHMDRRTKRFLYYEAMKAFSASDRDIRRLIAYNYLLDYEVKDISAILETKRFGLGMEESLDYLVRNFKGSDVAWL